MADEIIPGEFREKKTTTGPLEKDKVDTLMDDLTAIVYSGQILGVTHQQLGDKFGVTRQTISSRLKKIFTQVPKEDIHHVYVEFKTLFDKLFRECNNMLSTAKTFKEKETAIRLTLQAVKDKTELLERFHLKATPQQFMNVNQKVEHTISPEFLQEIGKLE